MQKLSNLPSQIRDYARAREVFSLIREELTAVERELERELRSDVELISEVGRYVFEAGGKRVRPALLLLAARSVSPSKLEPSAIRLGAVIELIHTATLVHDDIIDDAATRRGRPSVNARWGNELTVLVGDWLYMTAFQKTLAERDFRILDILTTLTRLMTEGELIQLAWRGRAEINEEQHLDIVYRKTACLFSAAAEIGAIIAGANESERQALRDYGLNIGMAFQLIDDVLDFTAEESKLGKPVANDLRDGKLTLPAIWLMQKGNDLEREHIRALVRDGASKTIAAGEVISALKRHGLLERAQFEAERYSRRAIDGLSVLPPSPYLDALTRIATFVVERDL